MATDRRVLSAIIAIAYGLVVWGLDHSLTDIPAIGLIGLTCALFVGLVWMLGRTNGALVTLLVAACLNRYTVELLGVTLKPEHIAAPLAALSLLPDLPRLVRRVDLPGWLLLGWLAWSSVGGLLNAPDPGNSTRLWAMLLLVAFPYFALVVALDAPERVHRAVRAWMVAGIAVGVFGIIVHFAFRVGYDLGIQPNPATRDATVPSTFYEANLFGSAMTMLGLIGITLLALGWRSRWLAWSSALIGLVAVQVSLTRTAWVAFVFGLMLVGGVACLAWLRMPRQGGHSAGTPGVLRPILSLAAVAVIATGVLWFDPDREQSFSRPPLSGATTGSPTPTRVPTLVPIVEATVTREGVPTVPPVDPDIGERISSITDVNDSSMVVRLAVIRRAIRDWREHPIAGLGVGSFGQRYITTSNTRAWISNVGVRILHDSGIVGLALFGGVMLAHLVRVGWLLARPRRDETWLLAVALSVATAAMFVAFLATEGLQIAWYWLTIGLWAATVRHAREQSTE